jgi:hypothetical protein
MSSSRVVFHRIPIILLLLALSTACTAQGLLPPVLPTAAVPGIGGGETDRGPLAPQLTAEELALLALPAAFRYEVVLRNDQAAENTETSIAGQYRDGAWAQTSRREGQAAEELIVAQDPTTAALHSYTRVISDTAWTRWPGVSFDAAFGLASPFTLLRLYGLAEDSDAATLEPDPADPPGTVRTQVVFPAATIERLLKAGVAAVAPDPQARAALEAQVEGLFTPQTVTYWTMGDDAERRVVQAAAALVSRGTDGEPASWVEMVARYADYDSPSIAVAAPAEVVDIAALAGESLVAEQATELAPGANLRVRVFANSGVPASDSVVAVYKAGKKTLVDEKLGPDAQFILAPGPYDVLVRVDSSDQKLEGVVIGPEMLVSHDVLFDFGTLTISATVGDTAPAIDAVVYPSGERNNFAGYQSTNPATFQLPAGVYDVEVGTQDGGFVARLAGVEVRAGLATTQAVELDRPQ